MRQVLWMFIGSAALIMSAVPARAESTTSKTIELKDFTAIEISGAYELDVAVGGDYRVAISGAPEDVDRAEATVKDGALMLGAKKRHRGDWHHDEGDSLRATVSMPALDRLSVSGVTDADITGVDAGAFKVHLSGVGEVTVAGKCGNLDARVSGVGELNARGLECRVADVSLSGMGEANVFAREKATAEVSGMGEINIFGSPETVDKRGGFLSEITVH